MNNKSENVGRHPVSAQDRSLLARSARMMVMLQVPRMRVIAAREGYTTAEHKLGWSYYTVAAGIEQEFDGHMAVEGHTGQGDEMHGNLKLVLQELDGAENIWFVRTRAIIRRIVEMSRRQAFESAFFYELEQQALGPLVVGSMQTFVRRVEDLETSKDPDAKKVRKMLDERGLTASRVAYFKRLIKQAQELGSDAELTRAQVKDIAGNAARQIEALDALRGWYNDWAATFRTVFNARDQVSLGIVKAKRSASDVADDDEDEDEEVVTPAEPVPA